MEPREGDLGVLQLNQRVRELLGVAYPYPLWLRGEVSGRPRLQSRGHLYFQLVERSPSDDSVVAVIDCALFAGARAAAVRDFAREGLPFEVREGMSLRVLGRVDLWPPSGRFQFIIEAVDPRSFQEEHVLLLRKLVEKLRAEGLLDRNAARELPALPLRIGVVTASGSAALEDFLTTLRESRYPFQVILSPAPMQGAATGRSVAAAMKRLEAYGQLDAVVITRGGGSSADLAWFDSETLGRSIAAAPWHVISGIGHEIDFTLPDFVAATRAKTPTHAASILVDKVAKSAAEVDSLALLLARTALPLVRGERRQIEAVASRLSPLLQAASARLVRLTDVMLARIRSSAALRLAGPAGALESAGSVLLSLGTPPAVTSALAGMANLRSSLAASSRRALEREGLRLGILEAAVMARDPSRMLALGWSLATAEDGRPLRSISDTSPGSRIRVRLSDGTITARTEEISR